MFSAHQYLGVKRLEKKGLLELFYKTQRLPDYPRAEDAVRRGWGRWVELEFGISADQAKDGLKIRQFRMLYELRGTSTREARQAVLRRHAVLGRSFERGDDEFLIRLGRALGDSPRTEDDTNDFAQVMLHHWLTGFWWLMRLTAVGYDAARIQGKGKTQVETAEAEKFSQRIYQIKSRAGKGGVFSQGWSGCFYSTEPPLINCIEKNGRPLPTVEGRRLLA